MKKGQLCFECPFQKSCLPFLKKIEVEYAESNKVEINYRQGEIISKQGAFVTHVLFLKKGLVKMYREISSNTNMILNILPAGKLLGLPSVYADEVYSYSLSAIEESVVCAIDKKVFEQIIRENGKFAAEIINSINQCTERNFNKLISFSYKKHNGRLADILLFLADEIYKTDHFQLSLSRKDLSEFSGMSVISLNRIISEFKNENIIALQNGTIIILQKDALKRISEIG